LVLIFGFFFFFKETNAYLPSTQLQPEIWMMHCPANNSQMVCVLPLILKFF